MEIGLACCLVMSKRREIVVFAIALFSMFAGFLIQTKWIGANVCPCTGSPSTDAQLMLGLDLMSISLLLSHDSVRASLQNLRVVLVYALLVPLNSVLWIANPQLADTITSSMNLTLLRASYDQPVDTLATTSHRATATILNRSLESISIATTIPSCGCTRVIPSTFLIAPGESKQLELVIDLNKSFQSLDQRSASLEVFAGFYDDNRTEIAHLQLFAGTVRRAFAPTTTIVEHVWTETAPSECEIPLCWFQNSDEARLEAYLDSVLTPSTQSVNGIVLQLPRPLQRFTSRRCELRQNTKDGLYSVEVEIHSIAKPEAIIQLVAGEDHEEQFVLPDHGYLVNTRYYDSRGNLRLEKDSNATENTRHPYCSVSNIDQCGSQGNASFAVTGWTIASGFRQSLMVPIFHSLADKLNE